nr:hypothetical protein [uncultured Rhodopila sp.]
MSRAMTGMAVPADSIIPGRRLSARLSILDRMTLMMDEEDE